MHISQIQEAAGLISMMHKAFPVKSMCWGRANIFSEAGKGISKVHHLYQSIGLLDGGQRGVESVIN